MKQFFPLAPWEYPGASFEPAPHAIVRHEIAGKKRTFWLKMREGVIYFREANRQPVYAIPRLFEQELAHDPKQLVHEWKREMERENYGAFVISHRLWPRTLAAANYCIIVRTNGSGWVKEHFDREWLEFASTNSTPIPLWSSSFSYGPTAAAIVNQVKKHFLERAVDAAHFQTIEAHWSNGSPHEMMDVLRSAAQLWVAADELPHSPSGWNCRSNSAFLGGSVGGNLIWNSNTRFNTVWDIAKWHYGYVGIEWKKASEYPELQAKYGPEIWKRNFEKWGENWRGNWIGSQYRTQFSMPPITPASKHDKLEALLTVREFLRDKMPADKLETWLQEAIQKDMSGSFTAIYRI